MTVALISALVLGVLILPMVLPVQVHLSASSNPARLQLSLRLLAGKLPGMPLIDTARPRQAKSVEKRRKRRASGKDKTRRFPMQSVLPLVRDMLARVTLQRLEGRVAFGTGDPADTGQIYGMLVPVMILSNGRLQLEPDFNRAFLAGDAVIVLSFVPLALVPAGVRFAWAAYGGRT